MTKYYSSVVCESYYRAILPRLHLKCVFSSFECFFQWEKSTNFEPHFSVGMCFLLLAITILWRRNLWFLKVEYAWYLTFMLKVAMLSSFMEAEGCIRQNFNFFLLLSHGTSLDTTISELLSHHHIWTAFCSSEQQYLVQLWRGRTYH